MYDCVFRYGTTKKNQENIDKQTINYCAEDLMDKIIIDIINKFSVGI